MKIAGSVTLNLVAEERAFLVNAFKHIKTKTELEERIVKRAIMKLLRKGTHRFPLFPDKECPVCERTFHFKVFDRHHFVCKQKNREPRFQVDPEILARIGAE
jgi:hypothetical protein